MDRHETRFSPETVEAVSAARKRCSLIPPPSIDARNAMDRDRQIYRETVALLYQLERLGYAVRRTGDGDGNWD